MNYKKLYDKIIENRQKDPINEGYSELHHIKPKSLGGSDNLDNLVRLSAREHFICHYLLAKMYEKESFEWYKMNLAFQMMKASSINHERYFNSRLYEALKENFSSVMSMIQKGENNSQYGTCWICLVDKKENKKIPKQDLELWETKGWVKGRNVWNIIKPTKIEREEKQRNVVRKYYQLFKESGLSTHEFAKSENYPFSQSNLVRQFRKYIPEYN